MVKIRLTRTGKRHEPHYRIVAIDSRKKRDGKYLEKIGYYNPRTKPPTLDLDKEILQKWLDRGAQPTDTVFDILVREGIMKEDKLRKKRVDLMISKSKGDKKSKEEPEAAEKKKEPKSEEKKETPKVEEPSAPEASTSQEKGKSKDGKVEGKPVSEDKK